MVSSILLFATAANASISDKISKKMGVNMYPTTHDRIVTRILQKIGLDSKDIQKARDVCLQPTKNPSMYVFEGSKRDIKDKLLLARQNYLKGNSEKAAELFGHVARHVINGMTTANNYSSTMKKGAIKDYLDYLHLIEMDAGYAVFEAALKDDPFSVEGAIDIDTAISAMKARKKADVESNRFAAEWFGDNLNIALDPADDLFMAYFYTYNLAKGVFADIHVPETLKDNLQKKYRGKYHGIKDKMLTLTMLALAAYGGHLAYHEHSISPFIIWGLCLCCSIPHYAVKLGGKKGENAYVVAGHNYTYKFTTNIDKAWYKLFEATE